MSTRTKLLIAAGTWLLTLILVVGIFGWARVDNDEFQPQNEFKLDTWVNLPGPLDINKGVLYVVLAALLTIVTWMWVANRMQAQPNRTQTAVETLYASCATTSPAATWTGRWPASGSVYIGTLFLFIWYSNLIGYIPLPTNSQEKFDLFGIQVPAFALFAATANISVPLVLALITWIAYNVEGVRAKGVLRLHQGADPLRRARLATPDHARARAALALHAPDQPLRPSLRQHPGRPPDHPVHGRRPRGPARASRAWAS